MQITNLIKQSWGEEIPPTISIALALPDCPNVFLNGSSMYSEEIEIEVHTTLMEKKTVYEANYEEDENRKWIYQGSLICNPEGAYKKVFLDYYKPLHPEVYD
jgi:hypothetical protein